MRVCRPFLPGGRAGNGRQGRNRRCALRAARTREPPRAFRSDAPKLMRPDQRRRLPFQANLLRFRAFPGQDG
jgi:hypothetical protein